LTHSDPPTQEQTEEILEFIEQMKNEDRKTFVHCHAGVGRTGTILHAYFLKQGLSLVEAEVRVKERRIQCMLISDEQKKFLRAFAETQEYPT
jgi:atypical dual specificity phosphatase